MLYCIVAELLILSIDKHYLRTEFLRYSKNHSISNNDG